jgi:hypothetical protein
VIYGAKYVYVLRLLQDGMTVGSGQSTYSFPFVVKCKQLLYIYLV